MAAESVKPKEDFSAQVIKAKAMGQRVLTILPIRGEPIVLVLPPGAVILIDDKTI